MKQFIKAILKAGGYRISALVPPDVTAVEWRTYRQVEPYTMLSLERLLAVIRATEYLVANQILGDVVECGVWRGGKCMAIARTLLDHQDTSRTMYCYDTYEGMTTPSARDTDAWEKASGASGQWGWTPASVHEVTENLRGVGYPMDNVLLVKGPVETTIPDIIPERISLLCLDTDWYESTKHELEHLYPRLVSGGVLMIDDYGHHTGAKQAVDEYFSGINARVFLNRIDYTGRLIVKP